MRKAFFGIWYAITIAFLFIMVPSLRAETDTTDNKQNKQMEKAAGVWDLTYNTVSKFSFPVTNYGIDFIDTQSNTGAGFWPRGSNNQYIYAGGFWFAARKWYTEAVTVNRDSTYRRRYVTASYNPAEGTSWMTPGRIEDGDTLVEDLSDKYRVYVSTDFDQYSGEPFDSEDGPNWPLWKTGDGTDTYVHDIEQRNTESYPSGPSFKSDEDIYCVFKDTDMNQYGADADNYKNSGYPLHLQFEKTIYSWASGTEKDIVVFSYNITNMSEDTLYECFFTPVYDVDIALSTSASTGKMNDRSDFYDFLDDDDTLDLAYMYTDTDAGEKYHGFGYIGLAYLNTPAIDYYYFIRKDKSSFDYSEQLGVTTFRNWPADIYFDTDIYRSWFISAGVLDDDDGADDIRLMSSTGEFHMLPGETTNITYAIVFASPVKDEADGSRYDLSYLTDKVLYIRDYYKSSLEPRAVEDNNHLDNSFIISPNPANDKINVTFSSAVASKVLVEITDVFGNSYYSGTKIINAGNNNFTIATGAFQSGVYFVNINDGKKSFTKTLNIIK